MYFQFTFYVQGKTFIKWPFCYTSSKLNKVLSVSLFHLLNFLHETGNYMFKVDNTDIRTTSVDAFLMSLLLTLNTLITFICSFCISNFEQALSCRIKNVKNLIKSKYLLIQNLCPKNLLKINIMTLK